MSPFHAQAEILDEDKRLIAALDCYFLEESGFRFKVSVPFKPYMYVLARQGTEQEVTSYLGRKFQGQLSGCELVMKEDLDLLNHLTGLQQTYIKCSFAHTSDLQKVSVGQKAMIMNAILEHICLSLPNEVVKN